MCPKGHSLPPQARPFLKPQQPGSGCELRCRPCSGHSPQASAACRVSFPCLLPCPAAWVPLLAGRVSQPITPACGGIWGAPLAVASFLEKQEALPALVPVSGWAGSRIQVGVKPSWSNGQHHAALRGRSDIYQINQRKRIGPGLDSSCVTSFDGTLSFFYIGVSAAQRKGGARPNCNRRAGNSL